MLFTLLEPTEKLFLEISKGLGVIWKSKTKYKLTNKGPGSLVTDKDYIKHICKTTKILTSVSQVSYRNMSATYIYQIVLYGSCGFI